MDEGAGRKVARGGRLMWILRVPAESGGPEKTFRILPGTVRQEPLTAEHVAQTRARLAAGPALAAASPQEYVIRKGDSLWSVARRFNVSQKQLQAWNDISTKQILRPGQKLIVARAG